MSTVFEFKILKTGVVTAFVFVGTYASKAMATCADATLDLEERAPDLSEGQSATPLLKSRKATVALSCVGRTHAIPGMTLIQSFEPKEGKLCYRDYSCGNVKSWGAFVAVSGTWFWYDSFTKILEDSANTLKWRDDFSGGSLSARVAVEWGQITRSCTPVSEEICL
jgi:hypothetical protein